MLVEKVPSPALSNARLGLPSFPGSTSRFVAVDVRRRDRTTHGARAAAVGDAAVVMVEATVAVQRVAVRVAEARAAVKAGETKVAARVAAAVAVARAAATARAAASLESALAAGLAAERRRRAWWRWQKRMQRRWRR
jgi:hypothetical protein